MSLPLAVSSGFSENFEDVGHFFEFPPILFGDNALLAFNRTGMLSLLAAVLVAVALFKAFAKPQVVPGKFQAAMEGLVDIVRGNIIPQAIGPNGQRFAPLLTAMFLFILVGNMFKVTPFINFPITGRMAVPAMLALAVYVIFIMVGIKTQGIRYFLNAVKPSGVPPAILVLLIPIEIVSIFLVRPLTLAVRLFANMMAGHILLAVTFIAANAFLIDFHALYEGAMPALNLRPSILIGLLGVVGSVGVIAFEALVSFLQAYIFTLLSAVYIGMSLSADH